MGITFSLAPVKISIGSTPNTLTLTLTNQTGGSLTLAGGTPVPETNITSASPTTFYVTFGALLTPTELQNLEISAPGWTAVYFNGVVTNWAICPASTITLPNGNSVVFTIANVLAAGQPMPGQFSIDYYNFPTVPDGAQQIQVFVQNPSADAPDLSLTCQFEPSGANTVYTTLNPAQTIPNTLSFAMSNPSQTQPVVTEPWGEQPPVFNITFSYSQPPGSGSLTTTLLGAAIVIAIAEENQSDWNIQQSADQLYWILSPTTSNLDVFAPAASVEIEISNLVTDLPVGGSPDITSMYIQYANLPGYNDGFFAAQMSKVGGPVITEFLSDPVNAGSAPTPATIYWNTLNTDAVQFEGGDIGSQRYGTSGAVSATLSSGAGITITAFLENPLFPSVSQTLYPPEVDVSSAQLPFEQAGTVLLVDDETAYVFQNSQASPNLTQFAAIDLSTGQMTAYDLGSVIGSSYGGAYTLSAVISPDGTTIYAAVATGNYHVLLITVEVATNNIQLAADLGAFPGIVPGNLAVTPDGSSLYFCWMAVLPRSSSALWVIDSKDFKVLHQYPFQGQPFFDQLAPASLLGTSPDGTKAIIEGMTGFAVVDLSSGLKILQQYVIALENNLLAVPWFSALSSDASYLYTFAAPEQTGSQGYIIQLSIDASNDYALSISEQIPVTVNGQNAGFPMTLGTGDQILYVANAQAITTYNIENFTPAAINWGGDPNYSALLIAQDLKSSNVFYVTTGSDWTTVTVGSPSQGLAGPAGLIGKPRVWSGRRSRIGT